MIRYVTYDKTSGKIHAVHLSSSANRIRQVETEETGAIACGPEVLDTTHKVDVHALVPEVVKKEIDNHLTGQA